MLAETCVFGKQSPGPILCDHLGLWPCNQHPTMVLLLPKLRSHFAEFLSGGSPVPLSTLMPAYLCRFAERPLLFLLRGFSWQCNSTPSIVTRTISTSRLTSAPVYFGPRARLSLVHTKPAVCVLHFLRHHFVITKQMRYRNINRLSIGYVIRLSLRHRLSLGG